MKKLDRKLAVYSGAAAAAAFAFAPAADATIIEYEGPWSGSGRGTVHVSFNLAGDVLTNGGHVANEQFYFANQFAETKLGLDTNDFEAVVAPGQARVLTTGALKPGRLGLGAPIGPGANWSAADKPAPLYGLTGASLFTFGLLRDYGGSFGPAHPRGYLGLQFDGPGTDIYYGWADIEVPDTGVGGGRREAITMYAYAYENSGDAILAGEGPLPPPPLPSVIPEPSTLLLLSLGAAGLAVIRRRRGSSRPADAS